MTRRNQIRLIFHGALVLTLSMLVEVPGLWFSFNHHPDNLVRFYLKQAHSVLMVTGIWMIATGMTLPLLELTARGISWVAWSLVYTAYTFALSVGIFIAELARLHLDPQKYPDQIDQLHQMPRYIQWINLSFLGATGATSLIAGVLIVTGAYKASKHSVLYDVR
jgi:hypothetical protein